MQSILVKERRSKAMDDVDTGDRHLQNADDDG